MLKPCDTQVRATLGTVSNVERHLESVTLYATSSDARATRLHRHSKCGSRARARTLLGFIVEP
jgi:hypothetical protein